MPRKGRGGKVEGAAGTAYANRTDLNQRGPQPITAAPGQTYGEAAAQKDAQRAVPMAGIQTPAPTPSAPQMAPQAPQGQNQFTPQQAATVTPGTLPWLEPHTDPSEPATHGLPIGDGGGPEVMGPVPNLSHASVANMLEAAANHPTATPQVRALADLAKAMKL